MSEPTIAAKQPINVKLEPGKTYAWCRCGRSQTQPFCDGSHRDTEIRLLVFTVDEPKDAWLCQCKHTSTRRIATARTSRCRA